MDWKRSEFEQLSTRELYSILRIRSAVLVVEYAHIHLDNDCDDGDALANHRAHQSKPIEFTADDDRRRFLHGIACLGHGNDSCDRASFARKRLEALFPSTDPTG